MEVALRRRLDGVAHAPHTFSAATFREAVGEADVEVVSFEADVCGAVVQEQEQRWLTAETSRFLLADGEWAPTAHVCVTGRLVAEADQAPLVIESVRTIR